VSRFRVRESTINTGSIDRKRKDELKKESLLDVEEWKRPHCIQRALTNTIVEIKNVAAAAAS
jgi:hypothetical protein